MRTEPKGEGCISHMAHYCRVIHITYPKGTPMKSPPAAKAPSVVREVQI